MSSTLSGVCSDACHAPQSACAEAWVAGGLPANSSAEACTAACGRCKRCSFASFSRAEGACVWHERCNLLRLPGEDFVTVEVRSEQLAPPWTAEGCSALRSLPAVLSGRPREWLTPSMLDSGVVGARDDERLACFLRRAAERPVVVAALGGSITAGLSYKTLAPEERRGRAFSHLYHRVLSRWLRAQWPRTQHGAGAINQSVNLGALCLGSMQRRPPDLALVEFGVNTNARELPMLRRLLRTLREAGVATIVVNVDRFGSWRSCGSAHCRTAAWLQRDEARRDEAWPSQVGAIEEISRSELGTPTVNLRRAVGAALGEPPYVLSRFMRDCRHPSGLGHAWLAQLIVHALQQAHAAAAARAAAAAPFAPAAPHCPAAAWPAGAVCLRAEALRDAAVASRGFAYEGGRKPGLRATAAGSWIELRVPSVAAEPTVAQLGYLQSWMPKMGAGAVSCAPPCACAALESLDAYAPRERASVTRLRAVRLTRRGGPGDCVLRVTAHRGPVSRGETFVVNSLLLSKSQAGPELGAHQLVGLEEIINLAEGRGNG